MLTKVKDPRPIEKQANVVYKIPCTCGKVYIGETKRRLGTRLKEHKDACVGGHTHKSVIAKHAWAEGHPINWSGTKILQRASHTKSRYVYGNFDCAKSGRGILIRGCGCPKICTRLCEHYF